MIYLLSKITNSNRTLRLNVKGHIGIRLAINKNGIGTPPTFWYQPV